MLGFIEEEKNRKRKKQSKKQARGEQSRAEPLHLSTEKGQIRLAPSFPGRTCFIWLSSSSSEVYKYHATYDTDLLYALNPITTATLSTALPILNCLNVPHSFYYSSIQATIHEILGPSLDTNNFLSTHKATCPINPLS